MSGILCHQNLKWLAYFLLLFAERTVSICLLYFRNTPGGEPFTESVSRFFPYSLATEAGWIAALTLFFLLWDRHRKRSPSGLVVFTAALLAFLYLLFSIGDMETMRWMGQRLSPAFLATYLHGVPDTAMAGMVIRGDKAGFGLDGVLLSLWILGSIVIFFSGKKRETA